MKERKVLIWRQHQGPRERARRLKRILNGKIPSRELQNPGDALSRDILVDTYLQAVKETRR
jgi:hypothetical protein